MHNSRFRSAVADLAAPIHGIPKDELEGEDIRQHRARPPVAARGGVTILGLLVLIALVATSFAVLQRNEARRSERHADAGRLAALSANLTAQRVDVRVARCS